MASPPQQKISLSLSVSCIWIPELSTAVSPLWMKRRGEDFENTNALKGFVYTVKEKGDKKHHYIQNEDVTLAIRGSEISELASKVSCLPWVRKEADRIQREIVGSTSVVVDGRDAGTKVFPNADVKIFLTASLRERAKRRLEELKAEGSPLETLSIERVQKEIEERDQRDKARQYAP